MYFPDTYPRLGDIWAGVLSKKICDHLDFRVHSGEPPVAHERASNPFQNLIEEAEGMPANELFWQDVDAVQLTEIDVSYCYAELANKLRGLEIYPKLSENMNRWLTELSV
jgi:hypothetical protein